MVANFKHKFMEVNHSKVGPHTVQILNVTWPKSLKTDYAVHRCQYTSFKYCLHTLL